MIGDIIDKHQIVCPECNFISEAEVTQSFPWPVFIHHCNYCEYTIMESEWQQVELNTNKNESNK